MRQLSILDIAEPCLDLSSEVHYLQSQNGNLFSNRYFEDGADEDPSEFGPLREHVPSEVRWCSQALGACPLLFA